MRTGWTPAIAPLIQLQMMEPISYPPDFELRMAPIQDVSVYHGRSCVLVSEKLLDAALHGSLNERWDSVVSAVIAVLEVFREIFLWKEPLPAPLFGSARIFPVQCVGKPTMSPARWPVIPMGAMVFSDFVTFSRVRHGPHLSRWDPSPVRYRSKRGDGRGIREISNGDIAVSISRSSELHYFVRINPIRHSCKNRLP